MQCIEYDKFKAGTLKKNSQNDAGFNDSERNWDWGTWGGLADQRKVVEGHWHPPAISASPSLAWGLVWQKLCVLEGSIHSLESLQSCFR